MDPNPDSDEISQPPHEPLPPASEAADEERTETTEVSPEFSANVESAEGMPEDANGGEQTSDTAAAMDDPLAEISDRATKARLSAADEEKAATLLKEALLDGRKGVERAVEQLPKLPWMVGVNGVSAAWPEMKTLFRARLIGGLAKSETDAARRVRLSLARGLFKQDIPGALKLAVGVAKEIREKETGAVTPKNSQIFANVLIGRAKPWMGQIPLGELRPGDADVLVHCAVMAVFTLPHAPATQLGIIKWVAGSGRLGKLHPLALEALTKVVSRWNGKWQGVLKKEVSDLPEEISGILKAPANDERPNEGDRRQRERPTQRGKGGGRGDEQPDSSRKEQDADSEAKAAERPSDRTDDDDENDDDEEEEVREPAPAPRPRPVYESKTIPSQNQAHAHPQQQAQGSQPQRRGQLPANFNLSESLRLIESHVAGLRSELQVAQTKLRQQQRDEERKPRRGAPERSAGIIVPGEPTLEELARLNRQLETRIAEQHERIEELLADSEDRAASMEIAGSADAPEATLRTLLTLKLQEDFEDFSALESEAPDIVVQQHYRTLLRHVFEVLRAEGVKLESAEHK